MDRIERKAVYSGEYRHWLNRLEIVRLKYPELYPLMRAEVADYREYAADLGQIDDLPPLPPE